MRFYKGRMKKKISIIAGTILVLFMVYVFGPGFRKETSCFVEDYSVSEDGREITLQMGVASSVGFIRKVSVHRQGGNRLELDCYSAFGGVNGSIGARRTFTVPLTADTDVIALYKGNYHYEDVLVKDLDGIWRRAGEDIPAGEASERTLRGTVIEIENGSMLVRPVDGSWEMTSSDVFRIPLELPIENMSSSPEPEVGDGIEVTYSGRVEELYPALLAGITSVTIIKNAQEDDGTIKTDDAGTLGSDDGKEAEGASEAVLNETSAAIPSKALDENASGILTESTAENGSGASAVTSSEASGKTSAGTAVGASTETYTGTSTEAFTGTSTGSATDTDMNLAEFSPSEIHDLVSAEISEDFGTFTVTDEASLKWLTELLGSAEGLKGWPNCPYETVISFKRADGTVIEIQPSTDSCTNYKVGDTWYSYEAVDNRELFALFGLKTEAGRVTEIEKLSPYSYNGTDGIEKAITDYFISDNMYYQPEGSVYIPAFCIFKSESIGESRKKDKDGAVKGDVKVYGNFWTFNYSKQGRTLFCESGGEAPGVFYLKQTGENDYEVTVFGQVGDGSQYSEDIKRICAGNKALEEQYFSACDAGKEPLKSRRMWYIYNYVQDNDLDIDSYQDYGWDPVMLVNPDDTAAFEE